MNEIELTKKLIEFKSISGNETEILEFLADFLRENSAEVWQNEDFAAGVLKIRTNGNEFSKSYLYTISPFKRNFTKKTFH